MVGLKLWVTFCNKQAAWLLEVNSVYRGGYCVSSLLYIKDTAFVFKAYLRIQQFSQQTVRG
jgi:hypothetical protein